MSDASCLAPGASLMSRREGVLCTVSAAVAVALIRLWDRLVTPALFSRRQRQRAIAMGEPCVLDTAITTVASFRRGGVALINKDVVGAGFPRYVTDFFEKLLIARGADQAHIQIHMYTCIYVYKYIYIHTYSYVYKCMRMYL